jgi:hypothetical protein
MLTVTGGSHPINMPVAAVAYSEQPTFEFVGLHRPVVTTNRPGEGAQNITSNELTMSFRQNWGFAAIFYLIDRGAVREAQAENPNLGFGPDTFLRSTINHDGSHEYEFGEFILGTTMGTAYDYANRFSRYFPRNRGGGIDPDDVMRGVIFDGYYTPGTWESPAGTGEAKRLTEEGEYYIGISIFRQTPNATAPGAAAGQSHWVFWEQSLLVPFYVDNTPPVFNSLIINGNAVDTMAMSAQDMEIDLTDSWDVTISGNAGDAWMEAARERGVTFDASGTPQSVSIENNLWLWALLGESTPFNRPLRVPIQPNGNFSVTLENTTGNSAAMLNLWLVDNYADVALINQNPIGVGNPNAPGAPGAANNWWNIAAVARRMPSTNYFTPESILVPLMPNPQGPVMRTDEVVFAHHSINPAVFSIPRNDFAIGGGAGLNVNHIRFNVDEEGQMEALAISRNATTMGNIQQRTIVIDPDRLSVPLPEDVNLEDLYLFAVTEAGGQDGAILVQTRRPSEEMELMHSLNATRLMVVLADGLHHSMTGDVENHSGARLFGIFTLHLTP